MGAPDFSTFWRPPFDGVEVLHARFRRHHYPRHSHEAVTVALMDHGSATFTYRGDTHIASGRDIFFINSNEIHTGWPASPDGYRYRVLYLSPGVLSRFYGLEKDDVSPVFRETVVRDRELARLLDRTHTALSAGHRRLRQEELLMRTGELLLERYAEPADRGSTERGTCRRAVAVAREYLEAHMADKVSLQDLSSVTFVSPHSLVRMFSSELGVPPHAYQTLVRVKHARRMLMVGARPIEAAGAVGFYDQAHFTRVFRRYTGVTPYQFYLGGQNSRN